MTSFRAVILAGGRGTRLRPYTVTLPKPLVPVGDEPILDIVMRQLKAAGVARVTLAVSHLAELLMAYFGEGARVGLAIDYSRETTPLGTVGPLRLIADLPPTFLVMNGDILTDLDFNAFWQRHNASGAIASVGTVDRTSTLDYGVMEVGADGTLTGFREKPEVKHSVSMGVYAFSREILRFVPADTPFGFDNLMLTLLAHGERVRCERHAGRWLDIGRPDDYEAAQRLAVDGRLVPQT
jgi:NDP-sugar pyrophosphorylase family protein